MWPVTEYPSYLKLHLCCLRAFTPVTYLSKLLGTHALAALLGKASPRWGQRKRCSTKSLVLL
ncbi:hypothetical protein D4100_06270 [Serratia inhibens]|uniref:Uncharacterized protein n=1 Tax=Serratia inhibens TaxID=2338073 RepID=A0AA92X9A4_9GAMM|nr:hypothetical protein D4100_06270 [Serratia inhibens]